MQEFCLHQPTLLSPRCRPRPKQSKNCSPKTDSQVLHTRQELLEPTAALWGNHRGTFWLGWNPVNEGREKGEPLEKEFLLGGSESWGDRTQFRTRAASAKSTWGKVDLPKKT